MSDHFADDIIDRRRLRRKLTFWRVVALVVVLIGLFGLVFASLGSEQFGGKSRPHVAKLTVQGMILDDEALTELIDEIGDSTAVKGIILAIDSPGGTTTGGEAIYEAVRRVAETKPVVAQIGTVGASAAYMVASATDHIVARRTSIVGSIGVIAQYPNVAELLKTLGVDMHTIKSSPLKGEPSMFEEPEPGAEAMMRAMVLDSYDWFRDLVAERRNLSDSQIAALADGSVFSGRQAVANKLIDAVGGEDVSRDWLASKGVGKELDVIEWKKPEQATDRLFASAAARWLGLDLGQNAAIEAIRDRLFLDGMVSVWHGGI